MDRYRISAADSEVWITPSAHRDIRSNATNIGVRSQPDMQCTRIPPSPAKTLTPNYMGWKIHCLLLVLAKIGFFKHSTSLLEELSNKACLDRRQKSTVGSWAVLLLAIERIISAYNSFWFHYCCWCQLKSPITNLLLTSGLTKSN